MPILHSEYQPKKIFRNGDFSTIYSALFRKVDGVTQQRERLELSDGDFLDLDWSFAKEKTDRCIILFHGLEGNAQRHYMLGAAKIFNENGFDCCAVNHRDCSGESNRVHYSYHSGRTDDVQEVIEKVLSKNYEKIILKGFSLGGNLCLKYAGEKRNISEKIKAIIAISTPIDLKGSMHKLTSKRNLVYANNFLKTLKKKTLLKCKRFPEFLSATEIKNIRDLKEFDDVYTSKVNGFTDAFDYYEKCSSKQFLKNIKIPTLLINAKNDSFLSESCFPKEEALVNSFLHLEIPDFGGHVGFIGEKNAFYTEKRALEFAQQYL